MSEDFLMDFELHILRSHKEVITISDHTKTLKTITTIKLSLPQTHTHTHTPFARNKVCIAGRKISL